MPEFLENDTMIGWPLSLSEPKDLYTKARAKYHRDYYREKKFLDTDSIIISYPKCGKGWINEMLLNFFALSHDIDPVNIKDRFHLAALMESNGLNSFSFTHDFDPHKKRYDEIRCHIDCYRGKKLVFLQRDPRDIIVSWFYYKNFRISRKDSCDNLSLFDAFHDDVGGMESVLRFLEVWTGIVRQAPDPAIFRYEDFVADPVGSLSSLLENLEYRTERPDLIDQAVAASSFEVMRKKEELGEFRDFMRKVDLQGDPKRYKTRSGKVGSYKSELTVEQIAQIEQRFGQRLARLGY